MQIKKKGESGFTLLELMVALTLFTIVVLATISSLLIANDASRRVQQMRAVMDNLNFAMDTMARTVRTGSNYECGDSNSQVVQDNPNDTTLPPNCPFGSLYGTGWIHETISLTPDQAVNTDGRVDFALTDVDGIGRIRRRIIEDDGTVGDWQDITSSEINVEKLEFYVDGARTDDGKQPSVIIFVSGTAKAGNQIAPFSIQTRVSQRTIE